MIQIIPAILATTEEAYKEKLRKIESCPELVEGWVQIDLMDNKFVQNKSIGPEIIAKYTLESSLKIEAHLMVEDPKTWIRELIKINSIKRIIFHIEIEKDIEGIVDMVKKQGLEVGLAINPETSVSTLEPFLGNVDVILIMGVHPGFQGQEFIPESINRIKEFSHLRSKNNGEFKIEIDGGITEENIKKVVEAGADIAIVGSGLFKYANLEEGLRKIQEIIRG